MRPLLRAGRLRRGVFTGFGGTRLLARSPSRTAPPATGFKIPLRARLVRALVAAVRLRLSRLIAAVAFGLFALRRLLLRLALIAVAADRRLIAVEIAVAA